MFNDILGTEERLEFLTDEQKNTFNELLVDFFTEVFISKIIKTEKKQFELYLKNGKPIIGKEYHNDGEKIIITKAANFHDGILHKWVKVDRIEIKEI